MAYAEYTRNNKSKIKRFSHQKRFDVAVKLIDLKEEETLLDYGTGDGYLLEQLFYATKNKNLIGYEPVDEMYVELKKLINEKSLNSISIIDDLKILNNKKFQVLSCQEVLEHFSEKDQKQHLLKIKNLTAINGRIIISVPLEIGFPSLSKNLIRYLIGQNKEHATLKNIIKSFLGLKIERQEEGYINSHIGFNHKELEKLFKECDLKIIKKEYSPFKYLYGFLNSQIFYIIENN